MLIPFKQVHRVAIGLAGCALALAAAAAPAAESPATEAAPPPAAEARPGSAAELVQRLDAVSGRLARINEYLRRPAPDLAGIAVALPDKTKETQSVLGKGDLGASSSSSDMLEVNATLQKLRNLDRIFDKWRKRLKDEVATLDPWRDELRSDAEYLRSVVKPADSGEMGTDGDSGTTVDGDSDLLTGVVRSRLNDLAGDLEATRQPLLKRLDVIVAADVRVGGLQSALQDFQDQLDAARIVQQEKPLAITAPALWKLPDRRQVS
ncbi:MAG: hypothetical protein ABIX37_00925, partial [Gammaproteobacteria bacterium]